MNQTNHSARPIPLRRFGTLLLLGVVGLTGSGVAWGFELRASDTCRVASGETHTGDLYCTARIVDISGIQDGDLMGWGERIRVTGEVNGDVLGGARVITIDGVVRDTVRVGAAEVLVNGTIEGDLLALGAKLTVAQGAHITGDLVFCGEMVRMDGTLDGHLTSHGARLRMGGTVGGSISGTTADVAISGQVGDQVHMTVDTIYLDPAARIRGDFIYEAREPVELEDDSIVMGDIRYLPREDEDVSDEAVFSFLKTTTRIGFAAAALLVGFILLALFGKLVPSLESAMEREALPSLGIGFVITIVLPVAAGMAALFVVTIPLVMLVLFLYVMALYLAKLPVALWLGDKILRALGGSRPSPYLGLLVGLVLLYIAFSLPFLLGKLIYFVTLLVGLGAIVVGVRKYLAGGSIPGGASPPPTPGTAVTAG